MSEDELAELLAKVKYTAEHGMFDAAEKSMLADMGVVATALDALIATTREAEGLRKWVVKLYCASGCGCCRDNADWEEATSALGKLLNIPEYEDGSGYNFYAARAALEQGEVK